MNLCGPVREWARRGVSLPLAIDNTLSLSQHNSHTLNLPRDLASGEFVCLERQSPTAHQGWRHARGGQPSENIRSYPVRDLYYRQSSQAHAHDLRAHLCFAANQEHKVISGKGLAAFRPGTRTGVAGLRGANSIGIRLRRLAP